MAAHREVELLYKESIATAGVKTINLDLQDVVSRIDIIWKKTNSNRTPIAHPGKIVKEILVCDGADVLFSMCGQDAIALNYYQTGMVPGAMTNYETGQWSMCIASINFGRWLWDTELGLDPKRFRNIQIKIDHNLALGGSTGSVADLSIYAHVFDEMVVSPSGFILSKEVKSFLPVANAWEYTDLPTDYPIRAVCFGANECEDGPEFNLANIKISEADQKHILVDSETERYMFQSAARDPIYAEHVIFKTAVADTVLEFYGAPHWERCSLHTPTGAGEDFFYTSAAGCLYKVASEHVNLMEGFLFGHIPFGQIYIPFGYRKDLDGHWDIRNSGSGKLALQAGATPDTDEYVRIHTVQTRIY